MANTDSNTQVNGQYIYTRIDWLKQNQAQNKVAHAIRYGYLTRPNKCELNDNTCKGRIEAHHYLGYDEEHWFDVQWLCQSHHKRAESVCPNGQNIKTF